MIIFNSRVKFIRIKNNLFPLLYFFLEKLFLKTTCYLVIEMFGPDIIKLWVCRHIDLSQCQDMGEQGRWETAGSSAHTMYSLHKDLSRVPVLVNRGTFRPDSDPLSLEAKAPLELLCGIWLSFSSEAFRKKFYQEVTRSSCLDPGIWPLLLSFPQYTSLSLQSQLCSKATFFLGLLPSPPSWVSWPLSTSLAPTLAPQDPLRAPL